MAWSSYPFKYLPSSFQPNQLVELILCNSSIKQLWKDKAKKYFPHLRNLDLSRSSNLQKMPDFRGIPNLERLSFKECRKLVQVDPSIGVLKKLVFLNLEDCENLASIPNNIFGLSSIEYVNLSGCCSMFKNQRIFNLNESASHSQSTMSPILKWTTFSSSAHKDLARCSLPFFIGLSSMVELDLSFCGLSQLPDAIGCLCSLKELNLRGNNFVTLPSLKELSRLAFLNLEHCKLLESLPQLPFPAAIEWDIRENKYGNKKGLIIFNCPKLSERELGSTINFSWMTQFIQANQVFTSIDDSIDFVVPGSEIPSWCNNQSEGGSIRIDLSPIMPGNDNDFSGIVCCAVFSITPVEIRRFYWGRGNIELSLSRGYSFPWRRLPITLSHLIQIKLDHMCLIYFPLESILKSIDETFCRLELKFEITEGRGTIIKCGYYWVCKQDHGSLPKLLNSDVQVFGNPR